MIKAIIFDCFGVLLESSYEVFKKKYLNDKQELLEEFYRIDQFSSRGDISQAEANEKFAELAGVSAELTTSELLSNPPNHKLLNYISGNLKTSYKIGMLSNVAEDRLDSLFSQAYLELFDDIVLSCQVGLVKPDHKIYTLTADRLGVATSECIFVDDVESYCVASEEVGMKAIQYHNFPKFVKELLAIFGKERGNS